MSDTDRAETGATRGLGRLLLGAAAIIVAVAAVSLAATHVAGTETTARVAADAAAYGAAESLLSAAATSHARLSEAVTVAAAGAEVDDERLEAVGVALAETQSRLELLDSHREDTHPRALDEFLEAGDEARGHLAAGRVPPAAALSSLDESYAEAVRAVDAIRRELAESVALGSREAGTLTAAARAFVLIIVPVLALTGVYRVLRNRQQRRELVIRLMSEQRLREERERLVEAVGHELRTPLTAVMGLSEALRDGGPDLPETERAEMLATVAEQSRELADRIDDLLTLSRVDAGALSSTYQRVDIRQIVDRLPLQMGRGAKGVTITGRGLVRADPRHLHRVLRNLTTCAMRAGGSALEILIYPGSVVMNIEIRDDGPAPGQVDPPREGPEGPATVGLGISMAAARRLTEHMGGTLERQRSGGWNISLVRFPLAPVTGEDAVGDDPPVLAHQLRPMGRS
ncbi:MAG: sensor histidine kinase [Actinomycetota bacterium]